MAEGDAAAAGGKGAFDFLGTKLGPAPIGLWGLGFLVIWYYLQSKKKPAAAAGGAAPNQQVDPAGNVGSIDPSTGYVYGSPEDQAAIASNANAGGSSGGGGGSGSAAGSGSTTAGQYATNADWSRAALNYLVGLGIDPTVASQALQQYLSSQTLTTNQQGIVNLAIQGLGAPPELPTAAQQNPTPIGGTGGSTGSTGGGQTNASNPVTGVATDANVSSSTAAIRWNAAANATSYNIQIATDPSFSNAFTTTAPASQTSVTLGNFNPSTTYYLRVQAQPASAGAPWSEPVSVTTSAAGVGTGRGGPEAPVTTGSGGQVTSAAKAAS